MSCTFVLHAHALSLARSNMVSTRRAPRAGSEAPGADAASQQPAVPASATKARRTAATPAKASGRQSKAQQQQQEEEQEQHALGQVQAPADPSTSQAEHEGRRGRRLNLGKTDVTRSDACALLQTAP